MPIRLATADDLPQIRSLCAACPVGPLPLRDLDAARRNQYRLTRYESLTEDVLLDEDGFMGLLTGLKDSITAEPQARVTDFAARTPQAFQALCEQALAHAASHGEDYLVLFVSPEDTTHAEVLQQLGFVVESHRIAKVVAPPLTESGKKAQEIYRIRAAVEGDLFAVALLGNLQSDHAVPAGRSVDLLEVKTRFMDTHLGTHLDDTVQLLVAEPLPDGDVVGYFLVHLVRDESVSHDVIAYIQDFTVHPEHYGIASHILQYESERALQKKGIRVLVGDISAANIRSLTASTRKAGFSIEANRWARRLSR